MVSAFSSLVNGGNYYQPHVVKKIADDNGNTVKTIEPTPVSYTHLDVYKRQAVILV